MARAVNQPSRRLARAAAAERADLARARDRLQARRDRVRKELEDLERQLVELDLREALLERLAPAESDSAVAPAGAQVRELRPSAGHVLRGTAIRETAVRVLAGRTEGRRPIHYREWLTVLEGAGYAVAGKDPLATFLTQVSRSPVVVKTTRAGVYELDHNAPERLRRRISDLQSELRRLASAPPEAGELAEGRARREALMTELARAERGLDEATRSLTPLPGRAAAAAG
jgi:hypothetical protein